MIYRCFSTSNQVQKQSRRLGTTVGWRAALKWTLFLLVCVGRQPCLDLYSQTLWRSCTARRTLSSLQPGSSVEDGRRKGRRQGGSFPISTTQHVSPLSLGHTEIRVQNVLRFAWRTPKACGLPSRTAGGRLRTKRYALKERQKKQNRQLVVHSQLTDKQEDRLVSAVRQEVFVSGRPAAAPHTDSSENSGPRNYQSLLRCRLAPERTMN